MTLKSGIFSLLFGLTVTFSMSFQCGGPPAPPPVGFQIHTMDDGSLFGTLEDSPNVNVISNLQEAIVNDPVGNITYFNATTDSNGYWQAVNAIVPANWLFNETNGPCGGQQAVATVGNGQTQDLDCISLVLSYVVSPSSLEVWNPPTSLSITGTGMTTQYGMPHVQIFNNVGTQVADIVATSVTDNGEVLTAPGPSLTGLSTGTYGLEVLNVQSNGTLAPAGAAPIPIIAKWGGTGGGGTGGCLPHQDCPPPS
jgi:hypothetical protein